MSRPDRGASALWEPACRRFFPASCRPRQSPAGRLLHRGFVSSWNPGHGAVGAGLAGDSFRRRASRGNRLQAGSYTAASFRRGAGSRHCRSRPAGDSLSGAVPTEAIACRQAPTPRLRFVVEPGHGTVGAGLAGDSFRRRARRGNRLQAGSCTAASFRRGVGSRYCRSRPAGDSFPAPCPPIQSPAGLPPTAVSFCGGRFFGAPCAPIHGGLPTHPPVVVY